MWTPEYGKRYRKLNKKKVYASTRKWVKEHPEIVKEFNKKYRMKNRSEIRKRAAAFLRQRRKDLKFEVIKKYGDKCSCCGIKEIRFLTIDHIQRDGAAERRKLNSTVAIYRKLAKESVDKKRYRILCMNCNFATRFGDICPHQKQPNETVSPNTGTLSPAFTKRV